MQPDVARRQFLGVSTVDEHDSLHLQLDQATAVDKTLFLQETQAVPHQKALMEHRRRMYVVMDGEHGGRLLEFAAANDIEGVKAMLDEGAQSILRMGACAQRCIGLPPMDTMKL